MQMYPFLQGTISKYVRAAYIRIYPSGECMLVSTKRILVSVTNFKYDLSIVKFMTGHKHISFIFFCYSQARIITFTDYPRFMYFLKIFFAL